VHEEESILMNLSENRLRGLQDLGQSVWLDFISRPLIRSGELQSLIDGDGLAGMTTNPSIFEKAVGGTAGYDDQILALARQGLASAQICDRLMVDDVRAACDVLAPVYLATGGEDGYVSIEVAPRLAHDTERTLAEARRLFADVDRPNVMVKIPGAREGIPAVRRALAEGLNVNITLMFSMAHYEAVAEAFLAALEDRLERGLTVRGTASVASFFVSRVDTFVDGMLDEKIAAAADAASRERLAALKGRLGVANSRLVYERFQAILASRRWQNVAAMGAKVQRVLWASTSTKNPAYDDVLYVNELIGPNTVTTMPEGTYAAFRDHGKLARTIDRHYDEARRLLRELAAAGIDIDTAMEELQREGVDLFIKSFDAVVNIVDKRRRELLAGERA
jgi:transaldolase